MMEASRLVTSLCNPLLKDLSASAAKKIELAQLETERSRKPLNLRELVVPIDKGCKRVYIDVTSLSLHGNQSEKRRQPG